MSAAKYPQTSLSVVIPAYSEEENIEWVVRDTLQKLPNYFSDFEVIIVDDGSRDRTGEIADRLAAEHNRVRVIHQANGGYSRATLTGIKAATKEFITCMPADGQFLIDDMRYCFEVLDKSDLVLGYRGGRLDYSLRRLIMSYVYLLILAVLFEIKFADIGWVHIWRREKLQKLSLEGSRGIFILTEIVVKFMRKGYRVTEAPSFYHPRASGEVKNAKFSVAWNTFVKAVTLWWKIKTGKV
ncbi:hypothetical protein A3A39_03060 [Candidatus Kaiserbacteria bacterium RIFCSPLOWO2_01_FULL_54_13]|uniref:Glycosyltransferase 2-like domain-containing protein n=1 Tax=Candidatus Kaiserbacteria bacterium RIFCSPLOWO2_01_FULL_54_13 TaxID=1798512 RepID=A0A1F6F2F3_9BACT|nr:MAG: hypothetical protein A3A39_03060 [Candidatus Kaiserbacteria bacterium RIFCSPLOWO2_01_FULL_54_13]